jgi:hypothetical protein
MNNKRKIKKKKKKITMFLLMKDAMLEYKLGLHPSSIMLSITLEPQQGIT